MRTATVGIVAEDRSRGHEPARARHGAIHDDDARGQLGRQLDRLVAVARLADHAIPDSFSSMRRKPRRTSCDRRREGP